MKPVWFWLPAIGLIGTLTAWEVSAASTTAPTFFGAQLGYGKASENTGGGITYGVNGGTFLNEMWGAGAFFRSTDHDNGVTSTMFGLDAIYRLDPVIPGFRVAGTLA